MDRLLDVVAAGRKALAQGDIEAAEIAVIEAGGICDSIRTIEAERVTANLAEAVWDAGGGR